MQIEKSYGIKSAYGQLILLVFFADCDFGDGRGVFGDG